MAVTPKAVSCRAIPARKSSPGVPRRCRRATARQGGFHLRGHRGGDLVVAPADRRAQQHRDVLDVRADVEHRLHRAGHNAVLGPDPPGVHRRHDPGRARRPLKPERNRRSPPPKPIAAWWSPMHRYCRRPRRAVRRPRRRGRRAPGSSRRRRRRPTRSPRRAVFRLAATAAGSSPTWSPRLKVSNGGAETPPARVVVTRRTRTVTSPVWAREVSGA